MYITVYFHRKSQCYSTTVVFYNLHIENSFIERWSDMEYSIDLYLIFYYMCMYSVYNIVVNIYSYLHVCVCRCRCCLEQTIPTNYCTSLLEHLLQSRLWGSTQRYQPSAGCCSPAVMKNWCTVMVQHNNNTLILHNWGECEWFCTVCCLPVLIVNACLPLSLVSDHCRLMPTSSHEVGISQDHPCIHLV